MTNRSVVYVTTRLFWPADSGRKVSLYHYCKGMAEELGYDVHLFSFLEGDQTPEMADVRPDFVSSVTIASSVGVREKAGNAVAAMGDRGMPLQCCLFSSEENRGALRRMVERLEPEVVIVDMVRLAPYLEALEGTGCATVVNFDDLLSKRYRRQSGGTEGNVLGKYGAKASGLVSRIANGPLKGMILRSESERVARAELRYGRMADACLFVSPVEAAEMDERLGDAKSFSATMGAEVAESDGSGADRRFDFGFVGNLHTAANQDSLRYIADEVMPLVPGGRLCVIGVCPDSVRAEYANRADVSFTGRVDSIEEHLRQCGMLLAPFAYGTGIKTKVLEAMGMGVPVVTNSIGLEGLSAERGVEVLCSDTAEGIAAEARRLLDDAEFAIRVGDAGRRYVERCHTWEKSIADLRRCLDFAVSKRRRGC